MVVSRLRQEKVAKELQRQISDFLLYELKNSTKDIISVTRVNVSNDLKTATVFISCLDSSSENKTKTIQMLTELKSRIISAIIKKMRIKSIPQLVFHYDDSLERTYKILEILDEIAPPQVQEELSTEEE